MSLVLTKPYYAFSAARSIVLGGGGGVKANREPLSSARELISLHMPRRDQTYIILS